MFFRKRKSRKQLLKEIEELKTDRSRYYSWWYKESNMLNSIRKQIVTISASCIFNCREYDEAKNKTIIEDCLCKQLAKELLPHISIEAYQYAPFDPYFHGETKYIATIKIVNDK